MKKESRFITWVDPAWFVEGHGFRVSIVKEGETGHYPTGVWPNDGTETMPWFWGPTIEDAEKCAIAYNKKLGVSPIEAEKILLQSMGMLSNKPSKAQNDAFVSLFKDAKKMTSPKSKPKKKPKRAK